MGAAPCVLSSFSAFPSCQDACFVCHCHKGHTWQRRKNTMRLFRITPKRNHSELVGLYTNHCQSSVAYAHQHYLHISGRSPIITIGISGVIGAWLAGSVEFPLLSKMHLFSSLMIRHLSLKCDWSSTSPLTASPFPGFSDLSALLSDVLCGPSVFISHPLPTLSSLYYLMLRHTTL